MTFTGEHAIARGDVLAVLRELPADEFDGLFCDPPYGIRFAGKRWDYDVPSVEVWREALRVLKPGATLAAFGGSRTFHRVAVGIEDAGFELVDCLMWLYAKGRPIAGHLRPSWEAITIARKPGPRVKLDVDACKTDVGRWPANVALDEGAAGILDEIVGERPSTPYRENVAAGAVLPMKKRSAGGYSDTGGPSRFFYCSKVSTREREHGCPTNAHPTLKPISLTTWLSALIKPPTYNATLLVPYSGAGSEMLGALRAGWAAVLGIEGEQEYVDTAHARIAAWREGEP